MSTFAASHLSPSYPDRAAWGTAQKLRAWQQEALELYFRREPRDFLTVATPGAGKTTYALRIASELLAKGVIKAITVVTPTEHLKRQWADAAAKVGISIDPEFKNSQGTTSRDYLGVAVTYAQVAMHPALHRARTEARKTLVIFDEIHHAGDARSWGDGVSEAFEPAARRLQLTGTPFRSDDNPIPFVSYEEDAEGFKRSVSDYSYGYGPALDDGVVRPVIFLAYSGEMKWRTRAGDELAATLGTPLTKDQLSQAWRAALDPKGDWIRQVMTAADRRLTEVRRGVPDAGGLVIATDHETARAYARHLRAITGEGATVVLSDDPGASKKIKGFAASGDRWLVAVRMVSEGVDIPRLCVGVYATSISTPLFFAQAVGRFVRARKRGEMASIFLPSVPTLMGLANEMEAERDHVLNRQAARGRPGRQPPGGRQPQEGQPRRPGRRVAVRDACRRRPRSTGCCSTAASSAPGRRSARPRRRTSWACPACWSRTRWPRCCASASPTSRRPSARPRPRPPPSWPRTSRSPS